MICLKTILSTLIIWALIFSSTYEAAATSQYDEAMSQIRALSSSPNVRLLPFGRSYAKRAIPAFIISDFSKDPSHKTRVFICAGQHGNEYNAVRSILALCKSLSEGKNAGLLKKCVIVVVPIVNPDGIAARSRLNAQGIDINRDWAMLRTRETQYVHQLIKAWKPQVLIDAHEWTEQSAIPGNGIELAHSSSYAQNEAMAKMAYRVSHSSALSVIPCRISSNRQLFHRRYTSLGYAAYLLETAFKEDYAGKNRSYTSAIVTILNSLPMDTRKSAALSPASQHFQISAVSTYLERLPTRPTPAASAFYIAALLLGSYLLLVWVIKSSGRKDDSKWSRRYKMCNIESDMEPNPLLSRHQPQSLTTKSWANRRLRTRYAIVRASATASNE